MQDFNFKFDGVQVTVALPPGLLIRIEENNRLVVEEDPDWNDWEND